MFGAQKQRYVYVFSDCVMYCVENNTGPFTRKFDLTGATVRDGVNRLEFRLLRDGQKWQFRTATHMERDHWVNTIQSCTDKLKLAGGGGVGFQDVDCVGELSD